MKNLTFTEWVENKDLLNLFENVKFSVEEIISAQNGDKDAMDQVLIKTHDLATRFFMKKTAAQSSTGRSNEDVASDLAQDVVLSIRKSLQEGSINDPQAFVSFVFSTCKYKLLEHNRNSATRASVIGTAGSEAEKDPFIKQMAPQKPTGLRGMVADEERDSLRKAIDMLPGIQKAVMDLVRKGVKPVDGAEQLNISRPQFDKIKFNAMKELRKQMSNMFDHAVTDEYLNLLIESL